MAEVCKSDDRLSVKQVVAAEIERVFEYFTQPELLAKWHTPVNTDPAQVELDLKVGGQYRISMNDPDCDLHVATGVFLEIDKPNKLVYTWAWEGGDMPETQVTVLFRSLGEQTEVELIHEGFPEADATSHHGEGWAALLENLAALCR